MSSTALEGDLEDWQVDERSPRIRYARPVMEELHLAASEGLNRLAHGGIEIGGVLFGLEEPGGVTILAQRPLPCEYAFGPSFTLSENDRHALESLLLTPGKDPELSGMQPVGWYHSHTRSGILLSDKDLQLFERYFPQPWHIALVVRPHRFGPTRAGFFFREPDGSIHAESTRREFVISPAEPKEVAPLGGDQAATPSEPALPTAPAFLPAPALAASSNARNENRAGELPNRMRTAGPRSRATRLLGAALLGVAAFALAAGAAVLFGIGRSNSGLSLRAFDVNGQLRVDWNCNSPIIQKSSGGTLEIEDGTFKVDNELSVEQLHAGSVTYMRTTGNVLVRLLVRVADHGTLSESARFLGPPVDVPASTRTASAERAIETGAIETVSVPREPERPVPVAPLTPARSTEKQDEAGAGVAPPRDMPAVLAGARRSLVVPARSIEHAQEPLPTPPPTATAAVAPVLASVVPPLPAPVPVPAKATYQGPVSGRIIWTGKLARGGTLQILENRASQGHVTGGLPGVPIRVQVFPADLTPQGLQLFAGDPKSIGATEAPGAQNAWNRTVYVYNPRQAGGISLVETPAPQNGWKRLILRAERGEHSIIVIRWTLESAESAASER